MYHWLPPRVDPWADYGDMLGNTEGLNGHGIFTPGKGEIQDY